uniref:Uncharacterized protein n=1 Tax=Echinococcus granulosus TaxID=6210 RepID=A0A068WUY2_ECHGR|nr:hypothetical protein EgrG_000135200 [Echinococcus granulosus]
MNHISADHRLKGLCNRPVIDMPTCLEESQLPSDSTSERGKRRSMKMNFIGGASSLIPEEDEEEASSECV